MASERQLSSIASSKRPCSWRTKASSPVSHQSSPYAGAAVSTIDQASSGTSVTPANAMVGTAVERRSASRGYAARCATSGRESPATCRTTAWTWLRSRSVPRAACSDASRSRAWMSTSAQSSWPSSASEAWPRANVGSCAMDSASAGSAPDFSRSTSSSPREYATAACGLVVSAYP